ncbi:MAG: hypothetical protein Q9226_004596 [Calogaya cf. arnoldii]
MASACGKALGINELASAIISYLPKKDLKSARLVDKRLASLASQLLIGTLYISPREIDMAAFDGITQHPHLSKSVKHVVYDTAQFKKYDSLGQYYAELHNAYQHNAFIHLGNAQCRLNQFFTVVDEVNNSRTGQNHTNIWDPVNSDSDDSDDSTHSADTVTRFSDPDFEACWTDPTVFEGYQQHLVHAAESCNLFRASWGARVVRGLKALGPITSFAFENAWNAIYTADGCKHCMYDGKYKLSRFSVPVEFELMPLTSGFILLDDITDSDDNTNRLVCSGLISADGTRLIRSPSARAWCPTSNPPVSPKPRMFRSPKPDHINPKGYFMKTGLSDGYWEFVRLLELLSAANKLPEEFRGIPCPR